MAVREFRGIMRNRWDTPLTRSDDHLDHGDWTDPWLPSQIPGAGKIAPSESGMWRSESNGIATGTSGWAIWAVRVVDPFENPPEHFEWIQVNWSVPFLGVPDVTFGTSRNDPSPSDGFAVIDTRPPTLEIVLINLNDNDIPQDTVTQVALYFFALPASFIVNLIPSISNVTASFEVRRRSTTQRSQLTFPTDLPSREQLAMQAFHNRMEAATALGFSAGFPNFEERTEGRNHLAGAILIRPVSAVFHDIPLARLGNVSLSDFAGRIRAASSWAAAHVLPEPVGTSVNGEPMFEHPYAGAFPTFFHADHGSGVVCGTVAITNDAAEAQEIPRSELGDFDENSFEARFRAIQAYATRNGFVGGFPTFIDRVGLVSVTIGNRPHSEMLYGALLLKKDHSTLGRTDTYGARRDLLLFSDPA